MSAAKRHSRKKRLSFEQRISIYGLCISTLVGIATVINVITNTNQIHEIQTQEIQKAKIAQASKVSIWKNEKIKTGPSLRTGVSQSITVQNTSSAPVYNVFILATYNQPRNISLDDDIYFAINGGFVTHIDVLPTGKPKYFVYSPTDDMGGKRSMFFMFFTDSKNVEWLRTPTGRLITYSNYEGHLNKMGLNPPYLEPIEK